MMCIASHAEDIINHSSWHQSELAKLLDHGGAEALNLTPALAYVVLKDGISHAAVQMVRNFLTFGWTMSRMP